MPFGIDLNHPSGVTCKKARNGGAKIYMYKDRPAEFFYEDGTPAEDEVAEANGYRVEALKIEREQTEKKEVLEKQIDLEFQDRRLAIEIEPVAIRRGQGGRYHVFDENGERMTEQLIERQEAVEMALAHVEKLRTNLAPVAAEEDKPEEE